MCMEIVGSVIAIESAADEALVETATAVRRVSLALLRLEGGDVALGDWVLVHTGFVISGLDEEEARRLAGEQDEMRRLVH